MYKQNTFSQTLKIVSITIILSLLVIPFMQSFAGSFSCVSNACVGGDTVGFSDNAIGIINTIIHGADSFLVKESVVGQQSLKIIVNDMFKAAESIGFLNNIIKIIDKFSIFDTTLGSTLGVTTVTTFITSVIQQITSNCSGSSCYQNASATGIESITENVIFPVIFIMGTAFGFMYMGIKGFGVIVLISAFMIMSLAYIGIIPSYFTLLIIVSVGAALTKLVLGMFGQSNGVS